MKIIGVDPGTTTGIALCTAISQRGTAGRLRIEATAEINGIEALEAVYGEGAATGAERSGGGGRSGGGAERSSSGGVDDKGVWRWLEYYSALECFAWVEEHQPDLLVIEDFVLQPGTRGEYRGGARAGLSPARIGAALGLMVEVAYTGSFVGVHWQQPAMVKQLNKQRLDRLGLWVRGSEHKRDAVRHAYVGWQRFGGGAVRGSSGGGSINRAVGGRKVAAKGRKAASKAASARKVTKVSVDRGKVAVGGDKVTKRVRKG